MKAEDLRIGNKICGVSDRIETIIMVGQHGVYAYAGTMEDNAHYQELKDISPIIVSRDDLLKLGFIENGDTSQFYLEEQIVSFNELDGANFWIMDTHKCIRCKYVHELQNTWKVFKGKELIYKFS